MVNNAGKAIITPSEVLPLEEFRGVLELNLVAPLALTQAFLPLLRDGAAAAGRATVVNVSSVVCMCAIRFFGRSGG